jgi:DNA-directed RNA polymerase subunit K/omega
MDEDKKAIEETPVFACETCGKRFYLKALLNHHIRNVHERPTFECEYCEKKLSSRVTQRAHQWSCNENPLKFSQEDIDKAVVFARKEWEKDLTVTRKRAREESEHETIMAKKLKQDPPRATNSLAISSAILNLL